MNIAEILKKCPKGIKLYSSVHGEVTFEKCIEPSEYPIRAKDNRDVSITFSEDGKHLTEYEDGECILFPSKDQRDWSKFKVSREDLKEGTPCICSDVIEVLENLQTITIRLYSGNGECYKSDKTKTTPWNYIIPINKFNFDTMSFREEDNYGTAYKNEI